MPILVQTMDGFGRNLDAVLRRFLLASSCQNAVCVYGRFGVYMDNLPRLPIWDREVILSGFLRAADCRGSDMKTCSSL